MPQEETASQIHHQHQLVDQEKGLLLMVAAVSHAKDTPELRTVTSIALPMLVHQAKLYHLTELA
jgi:hypothetical protein